MTYRDFLDKPQQIRRRIEHQIDDVNFKWAICLNTTHELKERIQVSPSGSTERIYLSYMEAKKKLNDLCVELDEAKRELRDFFYDNLEPDDADVLEWRYVDCKSINDIAELSGITYESAKNKISRASRKSEKYYKCY